MPIYFAEDDPEFRGEFLSSLKVFVRRIKNKAKQKGQPGPSHVDTDSFEFIPFLVQFCADSLTPGRKHYTSSMALRVIHLLVSEDLCSDITPLKASASRQVELFTPAMVRLLVDRLVDPYDEISSLSYQLLERIGPVNMMPWRLLLDEGMKYTLSGRAYKAEGGAKILRLCNEFRSINGSNEIWTELLDSVVQDAEKGDLNEITMKRPLHGRLVALR
jgi:hypothetical protein